MKKNRYISLLTKIGFILALFLVSSIVNYFLIKHFKNKEKFDSYAVDVAGRNRMLSQRIAFLSSQITYSDADYKIELSNLIQLHDKSLTALEKGGIPPGMADSISLPPSHSKLQPIFENVNATWHNYMNNATIIAQSADSLLRLDAMKNIESNAKKMLNTNNELVIALVDFNKSKQNTSSVILIIQIILNIIVFFIGLLLIKKQVLNPIHKLSAIIRKMAKGNLSVTAERLSNDEIGIMTTDLADLKNSLTSIIQEVISTVDNINSFGIDLNNAAQLLSQNATEQASALEEISSTMEELAANVQNNAFHSSTVEAASKLVAKQVKEIANEINETLDANKQIVEKIEMMNEITSRTSILSLNASVEAKQAGEAGKSFSVIASEVRGLATNSKAMSDKIFDLTDIGFKKSTLAHDKMGVVLPDVERNTELVQQIVSSNKEQNIGINQVNTAIQQLNTVTQTNASQSEQLTSNSYELNLQAEKLRKVLLFFNGEN
nr:methyl-accepting chemotaxis protein [uncultured Carboxylicivirga sp.]